MEELLSNVTSSQLWRYVWLLVIIWLIVVWILYVARRMNQKDAAGAGRSDSSTQDKDKDAGGSP